MAYTGLMRAIRLDPLSSIINAILGFVYILARRYDQALEQFAKIVELDPNFATAHGLLGWTYLCQSQYVQAIAALRKGVELSQGAPMYVAVLGEACAAAGHRNEANDILEQLRELSKQQYVMPYYVSRIYAALGEKEEAFAWLETSYPERGTSMIYLHTDSRLDELRSDPRFEDLLRRMNFPQIGLCRSSSVQCSSRVAVAGLSIGYSS